MHQVRLQWEQNQDGLVEIIIENHGIRYWTAKGAHDTLLQSRTESPSVRISLTAFEINENSGTGEKGNMEGMLLTPRGIAWNGLSGLRLRFAVADAASRRIVWAEPSGKIETWIEDPVHLFEPVDVALGPQRDAWIADSRSRSFLHYDYKGNFLGTVSSCERLPFQKPVAVRTDDFGYVYLLDGDAGRLLKINSWNQELVRDYSTLGWGLGFLHRPEGFDLAGENLLVADAGNDRLVRIPTAGAKVWQCPFTGLAGVAEIREGCLACALKDLSVWLCDEQGTKFRKINLPLQSFGGLCSAGDLLAVTDPLEGKIHFVSIGVRSEPLPFRLAPVP